MRVRELVRAIDLAFEEAGQKDEWIHRTFHSLYELDQLAHFQICDINWFNGADKILSLVDQLHSATTPKEDFLMMADMLEIPFSTRITKKELIQKVKANHKWKLKAFELENQKKLEKRKATLQPLFIHLQSLGYRTDNLPKMVSLRKWMIDALNRDGVNETIYLNESENGELVFIQSSKHDFIDIFRMEKNLFVHTS